MKVARSGKGFALHVTAADLLILRNICRAYEFLPIHRKVGAEAERLAIAVREAVDADPGVVASASAGD